MQDEKLVISSLVPARSLRQLTLWSPQHSYAQVVKMMILHRHQFFRYLSTSIYRSNQRLINNNQNNNFIILSLTAVISASAALEHYLKDGAPCSRIVIGPYTGHRTSCCACEKEKGPAEKPSKGDDSRPLSRATRLLYSLKLFPYSSLPIPRLISSNDPLFSSPEVKSGIRRRQKDEVRLQQILSSERLMKARQSQDQAQMQPILHEVNELVYGNGVNPQMREEFLAQYGCVGYTPQIVKYLVEDLAQDRGILEVGCGNGQWARALNDYHNLQQKPAKTWDFVLAYDNMQDLPLSPKIYHEKTLPANKYFYNKVQKASHVDAVKGFACRGRVLLLVYPSPGKMAIETVKTYVAQSDQNDTVVYVGEGIGGANANDYFFDYFLGKSDDAVQWVLLKVMDVHRSPGNKGYEKVFVFQRKR